MYIRTILDYPFYLKIVEIVQLLQQVLLFLFMHIL